MKLAASVRAALVAADYLIDPVLGAIGDDGQAGLSRNVTVPARQALEGQDSPLAQLIRLWLLQQPVPACDLSDVLPVERMVAAQLLERDGDRVRALVDIRPYGSPDDGASGWVMSDLITTLDGRCAPPRPDSVLGISPASVTLAQLTIRRPVGRTLDLGTGSGVQSLHLARHADHVVATDLNPRALDHARWTAALSGVDLDLREGSLYEPVAGERFDLIVTNPPYVMSPPSKGPRLVYREGTLAGDGLVRAVVSQAADHLNPGGTLQVLGNWAVTEEPWAERLAGWIPSGCDALIMERERLSAYEYVEMWLADAGLVGDPQWQPRYREWLDYFDSLGIREVGMGWIEVQAHDRPRTPDIRIESWPWAVEQPVGADFAKAQAGRRYAARSDAELLAARWAVSDGVVQEATGQPGAEHPAHIVLRSSSGFRRAIEVDTALGGVLGACDGTLSLGTIVAVVASLLGEDQQQLTDTVLPGVRAALRDGLLVPASDAPRH